MDRFPLAEDVSARADWCELLVLARAAPLTKGQLHAFITREASANNEDADEAVADTFAELLRRSQLPGHPFDVLRRRRLVARASASTAEIPGPRVKTPRGAMARMAGLTSPPSKRRSAASSCTRRG